MPTLPEVLDLAKPRDAQFAMASLVWSGTTPGEPLRKRPQQDGLAANRLPPVFAEPREGLMAVPISRRGKEYLETPRTLLHAAQTMTDRMIAGQLKALADDYQRRAEKASHVDAAKALARSTASAEREWHMT